MAQSALKLGLLTYALMNLAACQWSDSGRAGVLVIAVEGLGFDTLSCLQDVQDTYLGFSEFCRDSVRFTHAYTPSVLSQAALASIMTGRYPHEHGVRNNGSDYLMENFETVAEAAIQAKYKTAFFSGGAPILRKSGLAQGFEVFDDYVSPSLNRYYRPAEVLFDSFLRWQQTVPSNKKFFSFIYLNDLMFHILPTKNEFGVERSLSRESQLRAVDLALADLVKVLKEENLWHKTNVVLVGLNGHGARPRNDELLPNNLYSENSQVVLMVKPAAKARDEGSGWSIDTNVSLVDLGVTLFALVGGADFSSDRHEFEVVSLAGALERPKVTWKKDRAILTESGWARWRELGGYKYAVRRDYWLYVLGSPKRYFNTLIDRTETAPMTSAFDSQKEDASKMQTVLAGIDSEPWTEAGDHFAEKIRIGQKWAEYEELSHEDEITVRKLLRESPWDRDLTSWLWRTYLKREDWKSIENLATTSLEPVWKFLLVKLGKVDGNDMSKADPCLDLVANPKKYVTGNACRYEALRAFVAWVASAGASDESRHASKFVRLYHQKLTDGFIYRLNFLNSLEFDSKIRTDLENDLMDLVLRLPEYKKYRNAMMTYLERIGVTKETGDY